MRFLQLDFSSVYLDVNNGILLFRIHAICEASWNLILAGSCLVVFPDLIRGDFIGPAAPVHLNAIREAFMGCLHIQAIPDLLSVINDIKNIRRFLIWTDCVRFPLFLIGL